MNTQRSRKFPVVPQGSGGPTEGDRLFRAGGHFMQGEESLQQMWLSSGPRSHTSEKQRANGEVTSLGLQWPGSPEHQGL